MSCVKFTVERIPLLCLAMVVIVSSIFGTFAAENHQPFALRGYYLTFMRMPVMGLPDWKAAVDCFAEDQGNVLILWMAGGFRSSKYPITWKYNEEHANVRADFARELIDYAHIKKIRVLLGFTPFGYDGVNRLPLEKPELKARKSDGSPVDRFGIHSWGWNLCPAQPESQQFMREYIHEMVSDFYPNADGLLIESSDYAICNCAQCGPKYYDHEFAFVREVSDELWKANPNALILVYPHYFTGKKVPGLDAVGTTQRFDPHWGLFFTPHSAHFDSDLIKQARCSIYSTDAPALGTPQRIADGARAALSHGVNGYVSSFEAFSYVPTEPEGGEPWIVGKRMRPFGLDPEKEGKMPYGSLLPRIQRFAFREFSQDPLLGFDQFKTRLGEHFFGSRSTTNAVNDLLELQRISNFDRDWYWPSPLLDPTFFAQHAIRLHWSGEKLADHSRNLQRLGEIQDSYAASIDSSKREMGRYSKSIVDRWNSRTPLGLLK
ncbi:MAG: hypothetical protein JWM99_374 [Verrucomicrobiales bacterium]|nr:hypothetical protein [Verrucomicrobiales bacterium]